MPKKTNIIALIVIALTVCVTSSRIDIAHIFNQNKQKKETAKKISNPKIELEPVLESRNLTDTEGENEGPGAGKVSQKSQIQDEIMGYRLKSKNRTKQTQEALKKAGFYKGDIDGKSGPQTKKGVEAFQKSKGLTPDGVVGVRTWEELAKILKQ